MLVSTNIWVYGGDMIAKEELEKFKKIYREKFGKEISDADALESATKLLTLVKAVYRPIKKEAKE